MNRFRLTETVEDSLTRRWSSATRVFYYIFENDQSKVSFIDSQRCEYLDNVVREKVRS